MTISAREAHVIRNWVKTNQGQHPMTRKWNQLLDETIGTGSGGFPTTTTTTSSTSTSSTSSSTTTATV